MAEHDDQLLDDGNPRETTARRCPYCESEAVAPTGGAHGLAPGPLKVGHTCNRCGKLFYLVRPGLEENAPADGSTPSRRYRMPKPWPCIVVAVLFCMLVFTASAFAECAWVLIQSSGREPWQVWRSEWVVLRFYESRAQCEEARNIPAPPGYRQLKETRCVTQSYAGTAKYPLSPPIDLIGEPRRLPEAIDPRGPTK